MTIATLRGALLDLPPLTAEQVRRVFNTGDAGRAVIARALRSASPGERAALRDPFLVAAAALLPGSSWAVAIKLYARAVALAPSVIAGAYLDGDGVDGCVMIAFVLNECRAPHARTIQRAIDRAQRTGARTSDKAA